MPPQLDLPPQSSALLPSALAKVPQAVSTTTLYSSPTIITLPATNNSTPIPIGPIVGGVLAGIFLAVAAVLAWQWWGKSIKRKENKEKQEALAVLKLRENTRRNASTSEKGYDTYGLASNRLSTGERTVKFSSSSSDSNGSTVKSILKPEEKDREKEKDDVVGDMPSSKLFASLRARTHAPVRSSPLAQSLTTPEIEESASTLEEPRPVLPRTPSSRSDQHTSVLKRGLLDVPNLVHKNSTTSSLSIYSTQSGEERQHLVPPSLIMAALDRPDPQRPLVNRQSLVPNAFEEYSEQNRLSHISAGSVYLQQADEHADSSTEPVGYAK